MFILYHIFLVYSLTSRWKYSGEPRTSWCCWHIFATLWLAKCVFFSSPVCMSCVQCGWYLDAVACSEGSSKGPFCYGRRGFFALKMTSKAQNHHKKGLHICEVDPEYFQGNLQTTLGTHQVKLMAQYSIQSVRGSSQQCVALMISWLAQSQKFHDFQPTLFLVLMII